MVRQHCMQIDTFVRVLAIMGDEQIRFAFVPESADFSLNSTLSDSFRPPYSFSSEISSSSSSSNGGSFVEYLPQYEAVASGLGADQEGGGMDRVGSQAVVDLLNRECCRLLDLNTKDFWREVASDNTLHVFLESFLKVRRRWYAFPYRGVRGTFAEVIVGEHELSRRAFKILYRISSNQDPGVEASDSLSAKDHEVILQDKNLLDMAKLLDICAIYRHENEELTRLLVTNAIKAQPIINYRFTALISRFLHIVDSMYERCSTSLKVLFSSHDAEDGFTQLTYYLEVMDFLNDAIVSLDAFTSAYKHAAIYFCSPIKTSYGDDELLKKLARLHDSLLPTLQRGFEKIFSAKKDGSQSTSSDNMLPNIVTSVKMLSSRIVDFCWKLLYLCYLTEDFCGEINSPLPSAIFPAKVKDPIIRADILVQRFREISEECSNVNEEGGSGNSLLQSVDEKYQLMRRLELLHTVGWMSMNDIQLRFLSDIMLVPIPMNREIPHYPSATNNVEMDEHNAVIESKISQVKDLFPDYGKGFISACLEVYSYNPEEVIQRILEGTLHSDLLSLDTCPTSVPRKTVSKKDKGKGILLEGPSSTVFLKSTTNVPDPQIIDDTKDETAKDFDIQSLIDSFDNLRLTDSRSDEFNVKVTCSDASTSSGTIKR